MNGIPATLVIKYGNRHDESIQLNTFPFTIGRAVECDLVLNSSGVSRLHSTIERTYGIYTIQDAGSTNGTFVNGKRIYEEAATLRDGDEIRLGSSAIIGFEDPTATDQIDLHELSLGGIHIDEIRKEVFANGVILSPPLSPSQYALLKLLLQHENKIVPRDQIAEEIWSHEDHISAQMIDTLVARLRKRLADYDADGHIVTRRGFGLIFVQNKSEVDS